MTAQPPAPAAASPAGTPARPATRPGRGPGFKLTSLLLQYPTAGLLAGLDELAAVAGACPRPAREPLAGFLGWLRGTPPAVVAQHYVETFDLRRRTALYLTYYRHGDTRRRGMALLAFKAAYRAAGLVPPGDELPDYLPVVLDFAAVEPAGEDLLRRHRADLELLRRALHEAGTPYAGVVDAVCALLPRPSRKDLLRVSAAQRQGPPAEEVGLEPFAPPGYLTGQGAQP
jgi:nitrate reductase delta subunit